MLREEFPLVEIVGGDLRDFSFGLLDDLPLGNLGARRDWGFAGDYVEASGSCCSRTNRANTFSPRDRRAT
jgi:GDP-D-mannose dehydratase